MSVFPLCVCSSKVAPEVKTDVLREIEVVRIAETPDKGRRPVVDQWYKGRSGPRRTIPRCLDESDGFKAGHSSDADRSDRPVRVIERHQGEPCLAMPTMNRPGHKAMSL